MCMLHNRSAYANLHRQIERTKITKIKQLDKININLLLIFSSFFFVVFVHYTHNIANSILYFST